MSATPQELGVHTVHAYEKAYKKTPDYTQTCIDLEAIPLLACATSNIAFLLRKLFTNTDCPKARILLKLSRNKHLCTHFDEPAFIDAYHFYANVLTNIDQIPCLPQTPLAHDLQDLKKELMLAQKLIKQAVLENKAGSAYPNAQGITLYFPEHIIHSSYKKCSFAQATQWLSFLKTYLSSPKK